jgi:hypothetical protein
LQVILEDVEQVVGEAVSAVAFAVLLHLGDHASECLGIDFPSKLVCKEWIR